MAEGPERRVVVHLFSSLEPGGAEIRTLELFQELQRRNSPFSQVVFQSGSPGRLTEDFERAGARVVTARFRSMTFWRILVRELRSRETSAVHLHVKRGNASGALLLPLARVLGTPVGVAHFRSDGTHVNRGWLRRVREWIYLRLIGLFATDIIGVSPAALERGWRSDWQRDPRCRVVLSGVPLEPLQEIRRGHFLHQEIGVPAGTPVLLHVGRDVPLKNRRRAVEVLASLKGDVPAHLVFVGRSDPRTADAGVRRAAELGVADRVHVLEHRSDVLQLMADADLLLLTSTQEGLPGVVIEALSVGTPVVSSDLPGTRFISELIDGVRLVDLGDSNQVWARAVSETMAPSAATRDALRACVRRSAFDVVRAADAFERVWGGFSATTERVDGV